MPTWLTMQVGLAGAGGALLLIVLVLLYRRPWRGARTRYPIVLAHGLMGFDEIGVGSVKQEYFRGVAAHLEALGLEVHRPRVPAVASVKKRAEALAAAVRAVDAPKVNIIGHSMGGLDARYAVACLGLADRVASITSVGTPHHGTPLADLGGGLLQATVRVARLWARDSGMLEAFGDLGGDQVAALNAEAPNQRGVRYFSVVAAVDDESQELHGFLRPSFAFLLARAGANDGLVPASSQRWGKRLLRVRADHWAQVGWSGDFDAPAFYERIARKLRARRL